MLFTSSDKRRVTVHREGIKLTFFLVYPAAVSEKCLDKGLAGRQGDSYCT